MYNDDDFNWNFGIALANVNEFKVRCVAVHSMGWPQLPQPLLGFLTPHGVVFRSLLHRTIIIRRLRTHSFSCKTSPTAASTPLWHGWRGATS